MYALTLLSGGEFKKKPHKPKPENLVVMQGIMKKFAFSNILFKYCFPLGNIVKWTW